MRALDEMKKTADFINEMKRKADSRLRVVEILEEVTGIPDDMVSSAFFLSSLLSLHWSNMHSMTSKTTGFGGTSQDVLAGA